MRTRECEEYKQTSLVRVMSDVSRSKKPNGQETHLRQTHPKPKEPRNVESSQHLQSVPLTSSI